MSKQILIVGNSDGIGAAVTRALIERGHQVAGVSRSPSPFQHPALHHEVCDVASPDYPLLLDLLTKSQSPFDACIYCAGIGSQLELPDLSNEPRVFEVNLTAMVRTMAVLVPGWITRREGHFIGLSSLGDALYGTDAPSYCASKAGFSSYLYAMALRLRPHGVSVTNVRFGFVDTKMAKAPVRPLMMTPERAARHVLKALDRRPMVVSVPKAIAAATWAIGRLQSLQIRLR